MVQRNKLRCRLQPTIQTKITGDTNLLLPNDQLHHEEACPIHTTKVVAHYTLDSVSIHIVAEHDGSDSTTEDVPQCFSFSTNRFDQAGTNDGCLWCLKQLSMRMTPLQ